MVVYTCNPNSQEAEAGGSQDQGQPELHSDTLFQNEQVKQTPNIYLLSLIWNSMWRTWT
jgi:hypothetical protein